MKKIFLSILMLSLFTLVGCIKKEEEIVLIRPENLSYNEVTHMITWDKNEKASGYKLTIDSKVIILKDNFYDMSDYKGGKYTVKVCSVIKGKESKNSLIFVNKFGKENAKIVFVLDRGEITKNPFYAEVYAGIKAFAEKEDIEYSYVVSKRSIDYEFYNAITQAIADGATVIIVPNLLFQDTIGALQQIYRNVKFIMIEGEPYIDGIVSFRNNTASIFYSEEEMGFLAGYAAVKDGFRNLGFMGFMAATAVQKYGHGFIQGAAFAAEELGLEAGAVNINYTYTRIHEESMWVKNTAGEMYDGGVEVIFACTVEANKSIIEAAEERTNKYVIVEGTNQSEVSTTILTSSLKNFDSSIELVLESIFNGTFNENYSGKSIILNAQTNGISLPMANSRFKTFSKTQYKNIYEKIANGTVIVEIGVIANIFDDGTSAKQFETSKVRVTVVPFD